MRVRSLLFASYLNNFGWALYSPLYALFVLSLGGTAADVSFIWGFYAFIAGSLIMIFGRIENHRKYNPEVMLFIGYALFVVVAIGYIFVRDIAQFYVMQILLAVAMGIMTPAAKATYMKAEEKGKEAGQWGLFDGGNYIIGAIAAFLGGILLKFGNFELIFISMAIIQLLASMLAYSHWRKTRKVRRPSRS